MLDTIIKCLMDSKLDLRNFEANPLTKEEAEELQEAFDRFIYTLVGYGFDLKDLPKPALEQLKIMNDIFTQGENNEHS